MSLDLDEQYCLELPHHLDKFKRKGNHLYNFRCPLCGDSTKHKYTAHGYLVRCQDGLRFKCHLCDQSLSFSYFLAEVDPSLRKEYLKERFREQNNHRPKPHQPPAQPSKPALIEPAALGCQSIASLPSKHPARIYIESRRVPERYFSELYWADDFWPVANRVRPNGNYSGSLGGRIIIPFLNQEGCVLLIQGRVLDGTEPRYITIKAYDDAPRIYGMHRLPEQYDRLYVTEGPFDSMFLTSALALAGGDIPKTLATDKAVIIYDNEPRKQQTCQKIKAAIERGYRVCIWPDTIREKDINLMILNGHTPEDIKVIVDQHSYTGNMARFQLAKWRKD